MSDTSQGPGWWLASDGRWYPPELWTGPPGTGPATPQSAPVNPGTVPPTVAPGQPGYGGAPGPGGPGPYGTPYGGSPYGGSTPYAAYPQYGAVATRKTNGLAVASLVCSCAGIFLLGVPCILGIIFGFVSRGQIRQSKGAQGGEGLALAGIIVGFAMVALLVLAIVVAAVNSHNNNAVVPLLYGGG